MEKKSQSSLEFIILVGAMLFFFIAFTYTIQKNVASKTNEQRNLEVNDLALSVKSEIDLAFSSSDGYERTFSLPNKILNLEYNITLVEGFVYLQAENNKISLAIPVRNVTGQIQIGDNVIRKLNGEVFLN